MIPLAMAALQLAPVVLKLLGSAKKDEKAQQLIAPPPPEPVYSLAPPVRPVR